MCCRYYVEPETGEKLQRLGMRAEPSFGLYRAGDIRPSDYAPVCGRVSGETVLSAKRWGYPSPRNPRLVINARSETVAALPLFQNGFRRRRVVIPAAGFYEWNQNREKSTFRRPDARILYMAGICDWFDGEERFVIVTTAANRSMRPVHDRMPLILEAGAVSDWLRSETAARALLHWTPLELERESEYEQLSMFS